MFAFDASHKNRSAKLAPRQRSEGPPPRSRVIPTPSAAALAYQAIFGPYLGGRPLDIEARAYFEPRLGFDFGRVRIHDDVDAATAAREVDAAAFTSGEHVFFDGPAPSVHNGQIPHVLAHELAHVRDVYLGKTAGQGLAVSDPNDPLEREAHRTADAVIAGGSVTSSGSVRMGQRPTRPTIQRQPKESLVVPRQARPEDDVPATESKAPADEQDVISGTCDDIEGEPLSTSGGDIELKDDREPDRPAAAGEPCRVKAQLSIDARAGNRPLASWESKADAVKGGLAFGSVVARGGATLAAKDFGAEEVTYKVDSTKWTHDAKAKTVEISSRIFLDIHWDTQSRGRTNVSGPADPAVTSATWKPIADDLNPDGTGRPTRSTHWAQDLTERHEQFHASDDIGRAKLYVPTAEAWLAAQTIAVPSGLTKHFLVTAEVVKLMATVRSNVEADGFAYYDKAGGAGENRAYADGKSSYQTRSDDIRARAVTEKWK